MSQPLSPLSTINANATPAIERKTSYSHSPSKPIASGIENDYAQSPGQPPSSPFVEDVVYSPAKRRNLSRTLSSPKKELVPPKPVPLTADALRENEGFQEKQGAKSSNGSTYHDAGEDAASTVEGPSGYPGMDDTHFTAFSAVPNTDMTAFARLGNSPLKNNLMSPSKSARKGFGDETPRRSRPNTPASGRGQSYEECSPSPTPRQPKSSHGDTTNLLVDFTEQFSAFAPSSTISPGKANRASPKKSQTQPNLAQYTNGLRTPSPGKHALPLGTPSEARQLANLLDFDLPPAPTPRSIPSITARELESLKSSFLSQISSLRANLSGKEAEVKALSNAVGDAERRVGEALEELRDERGTRESLQASKADWEKRDKEMQDVLRGVKEEILRSDREKEDLRSNLEESERKREAAETRAIDAESKLASLRTPSTTTAPSGENHNTNTNSSSSRKEIDSAVERVAQELHTLYKTKHEDKVRALKKSYQARWEKKIHDLETALSELKLENEDLRLGRDATISNIIPALPQAASTTTTTNPPPSQEEEEETAQKEKEKENPSRLRTLESDLTTLKQENAALARALDKERAEMSDLIAATEEMMLLTSSSSSQPSHQQPSNPTPQDQSEPIIASISRGNSFSSSSRLKAPAPASATATE
ncbi:MAG: hypothetical protein Q9191_005527, partial [Dirinaria sp. TL-2023a]